jgi:hypothetical protein
MGIKVTKEQGVMVSLGTIMSVLVAAATSYPVARAALSQEIKDQVREVTREENRPLINAFEITLQQNVNTLRKAIAALEFKRDMCGATPGCWTVRDAQDLTFARDDLRAAEEALAGIKESKR